MRRQTKKTVVTMCNQAMAMKRSLAGLIVMSLGLIGICVCVISKRPVDDIINICFLGGMLWSHFSSLFFNQ